MTKRNLISLFVSGGMLAAATAFTASPALAEGSAAPGGTYLQSCQNIKYAGGVLTAQCKYSGGLRVSTLEPEFCSPRSDIANVDGQLGCIAKGQTWGKGGATPNGSYKASCSAIRVELTPWPILFASCKRPDSNGGAFSGPIPQPARVSANLVIQQQSSDGAGNGEPNILDGLLARYIAGRLSDDLTVLTGSRPEQVRIEVDECFGNVAVCDLGTEAD